MINIILAGVGGQGTMLTAKVLSVAAATRGWDVRASETIGVRQRGGSVVSHIRMADKNEEIHSPLITKGTADLIIGFEPGEAARALPYLARTGAIVMATTPIESVSAALSIGSYNVAEIIEGIQLALYNAMVKNISGSDGFSPKQGRLIPVDDSALTDILGENRKVLNSILLAQAVKSQCIPFTDEELRNAIAACVKPDFVEMNFEAIDLVMGM